MKFLINKKAAMFGLDARIALAIFGALSVITGAALYSAISHAKTVQLATQAKEIEKAVEQYMLDTGNMLPLVAATTVKNLDISALINKPVDVVNWNGPYLNGKMHDTEVGWLQVNNKSFVLKIQSEPYGTCTKSSLKCFLVLFGLNNHDENLKLENYIDGTVNPTDSDYTKSFYYDKSWGNKWGMFKTQIPFDPKNSPNT